LTEYNTAQNRRIPQIPITVEEARKKKRKRPKLGFLDEEEVINPEDVDPTIGRFRNLVRTAVIPTSANSTKRPASDADEQLFEFYGSDGKQARKQHLRDDENTTTTLASSDSTLLQYSSVASISLNAAPSLEIYAPKVVTTAAVPQTARHNLPTEGPSPAIDVHGKKKYAKEAWPGRKPGAGMV